MWVKHDVVAAQAMPDQCVPLSLVRIWVIASTLPASLVALLEGLLERISTDDAPAVGSAALVEYAFAVKIRGRVVFRYAFPDQPELPFPPVASHFYVAFTPGNDQSKEIKSRIRVQTQILIWDFFLYVRHPFTIIIDYFYPFPI